MATFAFALGLKEKPRAEARRDLKWLCEPLASPEAAPYSAAHVSGAMARLSQAPVFVLTAPYASAPRIAMAVGTAAAERGYRFNRRQGGGRHRNAEQHQPEQLYKVHGYVLPIKAVWGGQNEDWCLRKTGHRATYVGRGIWRCFR